MGKAFIRGRVLYTEIFDQRGPYLYLLYGLASLVSATTFTGVFLLEWLSFSLFLLVSYQLVRLYAPRTAWVSIPVLAKIIASSTAFVMGGSPEQILLPCFAYTTLSIVRYIKSDDNTKPTTISLLANGILCGVVMWTKYNLLGFYLGYVLSITIIAIIRNHTSRLLHYYAFIFIGILIATLPWIAYFGAHHAIGDWINGYILQNISNYAFRLNGLHEILLSIFANLGYSIIMNLQYSLFILIGLVWVLISKRPVLPRLEKGCIWLVFLLSAIGIYVGGVSHIYYGLPLSTFALFGIIAFLQFAEAYRLKSALSRKIVQVGSIVAALLLLFTGLNSSMNIPYLQSRREDSALYQFRDIINKSESPTLMNYGSLDLGLYTLCDITPQTKFFCNLNLASKEMVDTIDGYLKSGKTEFVVSVCGDLQDRFEKYELVDSQYSILNDGRAYVYLYQVKDVPPTN